MSALLGAFPLTAAIAGDGGCPSPCQPGFFCQTPAGQCGGAGTCVQMPQVCPLIFDPVCGCDGQTYSNGCFAAAAGVSVAHAGPCGTTSTCTDNGNCPDGFFCQKKIGDCDGVGTCLAMPTVCPLVFIPVCGCDGQNYDNPCLAAAAGASVAHFGPCQPVPDADLNDDGAINTLDLGILLAAWSIPPGMPGCGGLVPCPADINGDGVVDNIDLGILLSNWTI